jgi:hypothetical protein
VLLRLQIFIFPFYAPLRSFSVFISFFRCLRHLPT